jgi:hypothetical protein
MSSILKAIRKAEDEKRAGDSVAPDLMVDHGQSTPKSKPTTLLPLTAGVVVGAVIVVVAILLFDVADESSLDKQSNREDSVAKAPLVTREKPPTSRNTTSAVREAARVSDSVADGSQKIVKEEVFVSAPVKGFQPAAPDETVDNTILQPKEDRQKTDVISSESDKNTSVPPGIQLVVTEIFHQENDANSMAVVNDLPVMIGTYVDSALVKAINKNSVEFDFNGNSLLISVSEP